MTDIAEPLPTVAIPSSQSGDLSVRIRRGAEYVVIPLLALGITAFLFSLFLLALGKSPIQFFELVERGGFGTAFSLQNTLQRSSPLILTALCVALPARIGLVIIGGEGALVLGGFASAVVAIPLVLGKVSPLLTLLFMASTGMLVGAFWIGIVGYLRYARGVNETISSLLMTYIGIAIMNFFVEGSLRDLTNPNKPSTMPIGDAYMVGHIPGTDVHWGLIAGIVLSILLYILLSRTTFGFAVRVAGGNPRAALAQGLPVASSLSSAVRSPAPVPAWLVSSRSRRSRAAPMRRWPPVTATPEFWCRSSRATIRWRSSRWRSCSAALSPRAASSSVAWSCPTQRSYCCKD